VIKVAINRRASDGQCEMISCKGKRRASRHVPRELVKYDGAGNRLVGRCGWGIRCDAFKVGITPSRIARQFGLSQSNVRKALASDESKR
jgi:hypothetical protein